MYPNPACGNFDRYRLALSRHHHAAYPSSDPIIIVLVLVLWIIPFVVTSSSVCLSSSGNVVTSNSPTHECSTTRLSYQRLGKSKFFGTSEVKHFF
jgi:hypothetical protein